MNEQDEDLVKTLLQRQQEMESDRLPWESQWRDIDRRVNPTGDGGFTPKAPSQRGLENFDVTAIEGLDRFCAVIAALSIPRKSIWHGLEFSDPELMKIDAVKRWCETATRRLFAMRYASSTGFTVQGYEDIQQLGGYGTAPLWIFERPGKGLGYKTLHLSEVFIDEDFTGRVDTVHRKFELSARQAAQQFGVDALPPKVREAYADPKKCENRFQFLHVVRPNPKIEPDRFDWRAKPIESLYIGIDEKWIIQRGGFWSFPIAVSRNATSPRDKYGRSPAMKVIAGIKTVNEMAKTLLRGAHKAVDPPIAFHDDGDISRLALKPGGLNPGLIDQMGRALVKPIELGGALPFGMEILEQERAPIRKSFLEEFFTLLSNPSDRMTATQVLETLRKEGVLVAPFADRYEAEKLTPLVMRELDIAMRAKQLPPLPAEVIEAGAKAQPVMTNPLSRMARAEEAAGFTRWTEVAVQLAAFDEEVMDVVDTEAGLRGVAEVLGVPPTWIRSPADVAARREARVAAKEEAQLLEGAPKAAGAVLDLARASEISGAV